VPVPSPDVSRSPLFQAARQRAELSVDELWLRYLALTGTCDVFELDAFLNDLTVWMDHEQNVLACALNERLDELYQAVRVPYLMLSSPTSRPEDPLAVLHELLADEQGRDDASNPRTMQRDQPEAS
jgi:hypothetical protein